MSEGALSGRVALVTGASRGIGRAIAREPARCGARVYPGARDERGGRWVRHVECVGPRLAARGRTAPYSFSAPSHTLDTARALEEP